VSGSGFLAIVVLLGLLWVFVVLPVRRRQRAQAASHEAMQDSLAPGDEIITAGGLYAIVRSIEDERLEIEIAPGVVATLDRRAVAAVADDLEEAEDAIGGGEHDSAESPGDENPADESAEDGSDAADPEAEGKPR
jgi:preprotein translocase subunit YajC